VGSDPKLCASLISSPISPRDENPSFYLTLRRALIGQALPLVCIPSMTRSSESPRDYEMIKINRTHFANQAERLWPGEAGET
jgi:hypothetical protein